jgi:hypothetical protein
MKLELQALEILERIGIRKERYVLSLTNQSRRRLYEQSSRNYGPKF